MVREPLTAAAAVGANTTFTVQLAPTAKVAPQVPPAAGRENGAPAVSTPPANARVPVFLTVTVRAALVVPVAQLPNASAAGVTVAVETATMPVPLTVTGDPVTEALPAMMVSAPPTAPAAVGVNVTMMVQETAATVSVAPQVPPARLNCAGKVTTIPVRSPVPVLRRVSVRAALVVLTAALPNANGPPVTAAMGVLDAATNATAPTSTDAKLTLRGFPK